MLVHPQAVPQPSGSAVMAKKTGPKKPVHKPASEPDLKGPVPDPKLHSELGRSTSERNQDASTHVDILHFKMGQIHHLSWNQILKVITLTAAVTAIFVGAISAILYELHLAYPSGPPWELIVGSLTAVLGVSAWGIARDELHARAAARATGPQIAENDTIDGVREDDGEDVKASEDA
jgi:hypothetical protein